MRGEMEFTMTELGHIMTARVSLGIGLGLLLANTLSKNQRRAVGSTLLLIGTGNAAIIGWELFGRRRSFRLSFGKQDSVQKQVEPGGPQG